MPQPQFLPTVMVTNFFLGKETSKQKSNAHSHLNRTAQNAIVNNSYKSKFHKKINNLFQVMNSLDPFSSDRTLRPTCSLLGSLVKQLPLKGFDDARLVGFGGIAMVRAVCETLNHFHSLLRRPVKQQLEDSDGSISLPSIPSNNPKPGSTLFHTTNSHFVEMDFQRNLHCRILKTIFSNLLFQ